MITIEFRPCGFGIKRRWEFGDPTRSPIKVYEFGLIKICQFQAKSRFVGFIRGYCYEKESMEWHPKVRLAKRIARSRAKVEADKNWQARYSDMLSLVAKYEKELSTVKAENHNLLRAIQIVKDHQTDP